MSPRPILVLCAAILLVLPLSLLAGRVWINPFDPDTRNATSVATASTPTHVTNLRPSTVHCTKLFRKCANGVKPSTKAQLSERLRMSQSLT